MPLSSPTTLEKIDWIGLKIQLQDFPPVEKVIGSDPTFAKSSQRKLYLLAAWKCFNPHDDLYDINGSFFGGLIGVENSQLESILFSPKLKWMRTVFHVATGFMMSISKKGFGCFYVFRTHSPKLLKKSLDMSGASS